MSVQDLIPVVVVGGTLNALGVVRSLSPARLPIFLVVTTRRRPAAWSRFCNVVRIRTAKGPGLIDGLKDLSGRLGRAAVLLLTEDADVEVASTVREELEGRFHLSLPSKEMVRILADKTLFQNFAEREGFPVPRGVVLGEIKDFPSVKNLTLPLVIKPYNSAIVSDRGIKKAVLVNTLVQAHAAATDMLKGAGRIVVQEWIEGADSDIFFTLFACDSDSRTTGLFSGRKLACHPRGVGNTALCIAAEETREELTSLSMQFITRTRYRGLGGLEFKRDRKTGKFVIIEPTVGRTDAQEEIATLCGVNIPLIAYWTALGHPFEQTPGRPVKVAWRSSIQHRAPAGALTHGTKIVDGHFRLADPLPGLYHYVLEVFVQRIWWLAKLVSRLCHRSIASRKQHPAIETVHTNR